jgi:phosphatidylglycerophosphate synthase
LNRVFELSDRVAVGKWFICFYLGNIKKMASIFILAIAGSLFVEAWVALSPPVEHFKKKRRATILH